MQRPEFNCCAAGWRKTRQDWCSCVTYIIAAAAGIATDSYCLYCSKISIGVTAPKLQISNSVSVHKRIRSSQELHIELNCYSLNKLCLNKVSKQDLFASYTCPYYIAYIHKNQWAVITIICYAWLADKMVFQLHCHTIELLWWYISHRAIEQVACMWRQKYQYSNTGATTAVTGLVCCNSVCEGQKRITTKILTQNSKSEKTCTNDAPVKNLHLQQTVRLLTHAVSVEFVCYICGT